MHTVSLMGEIKSDHTLTVTVPADLPPGPVLVSVTTVPTSERALSPTEFLDSEFFGDWSGRDDLPQTPEAFAAWRNRVWDGKLDEAS